MWSVSTIVSIASIIGTYIALSQAKTVEVFLTWTISQVVWLALKSTLFHMVDDRERPYHANFQGQPWSKLSLQEKARVQDLIFALAKYQRHIHLRQYRSYSEDLELITNVENVQKEFPPSPAHNATIAIIVNGVVGDTMISNASWIAGTKKAAWISTILVL
jgi:hypothetical protein